MLIFTIGERQLINTAVNRFGDDRQRSIWRSWAADHPNVRRGPADPWDDGQGSMPSQVTEVVISTLNQMSAAGRSRFETGKLSEDEVADLGNELTDIQSIAKSLS